jgi:hypothetical protein
MTQETTHPFSQNIFYEPIPFELLKTYETAPQIMVSVNNTPAVCHSMACDFTYTVAAAEVNAFTFDPSTLLVTVTGTTLPTTTPDIHSIRFAQTDCTMDNSTVTDTGFSCTLVH